MSTAKSAKALVDMQDGRVIDIYHESLKFDLFPLNGRDLSAQKTTDAHESQVLESRVQLGKRERPTGSVMASSNNPLVLLPAQLKALEDSASPNFEAYLFCYLSQLWTSKDVVNLYMRDKEEMNLHLLDYCLNTFDQREHQEGWVAWYIGYRVHQLAERIQAKVSSRSSKTILTNTSHRILAGIL